LIEELALERALELMKYEDSIQRVLDKKKSSVSDLLGNRTSANRTRIADTRHHLKQIKETYEKAISGLK